MNRELWEEVSRYGWLSDKQIDRKRSRVVGEGLASLPEEWMNLIRFSYQMDQYSVLKSVDELGATTTIVILVFNKEDIETPEEEDEYLLERMIQQGGEVGEIATIVKEDDSLILDGAGISERVDDVVVLNVVT